MKSEFVISVLLFLSGCALLSEQPSDQYPGLGGPVALSDYDKSGYVEMKDLDHTPAVVWHGRVGRSPPLVPDDYPSFRSKVKLLVFVNVSGEVEDVLILEADHKLVALRVVSRIQSAKFEPGKLNGVVVPFVFSFETIHTHPSEPVDWSF
ncbi:MAG: hypothetical protein JJU20_04260 [Opitutales bacterium]|nr:hypothetical protein [Opitutales bacterium]